MRPCAILRDSDFRPGQAWHRRCGSDVKGESTSLLVRAAPSRQTHSSMRSVSLSRTIFLSYYLLYSISEEASYPTHRKYPLCPQLAKDFPGQVVWSSIDVTDAQAAVGLEQLVKRVGGSRARGSHSAYQCPGLHKNGRGCLPLFCPAGS